MEAYDARRNLIKEDDDGGDGYNAKIELIVSSGTVHFFKLRGYDEDERGLFRIFASHSPMPPITELRPGSSQSGNIEIGKSYWFSVRPASNGVLTVETTGDTDTMLEVYNENFVFLDEDDDSGTDLNAKIVLNVRQGRTYYFILSAYDTDSGPYRISARVE